MDIGAGNSYPACSLSNFSAHPFVLDGVECASMEGFLQSLKFKSADMQKEVCKLVGRKAKFRGKSKNWRRTQTLYWQGQEIDRHSPEYQTLLDRAYDALGQNKSFRCALEASGDATLEHSIGKNKPNLTVLTVSEFTKRLYRLRERFKQDNRQ